MVEIWHKSTFTMNSYQNDTDMANCEIYGIEVPNEMRALHTMRVEEVRDRSTSGKARTGTV